MSRMKSYAMEMEELAQDMGWIEHQEWMQQLDDEAMEELAKEQEVV